MPKATGSYRTYKSLEKLQTWHDEFSTAKDSGRKLPPVGRPGEGYWGRRHHAVKITEEKITDDWSMECEDSSASWEVGKFEGRDEKNKVDVIGISEVMWEQSGELKG